jgi:hypothetical protein
MRTGARDEAEGEGDLYLKKDISDSFALQWSLKNDARFLAWKTFSWVNRSICRYREIKL